MTTEHQITELDDAEEAARPADEPNTKAARDELRRLRKFAESGKKMHPQFSLLLIQLAEDVLDWLENDGSSVSWMLDEDACRFVEDLTT